jgi:uncharacterized protein YndB with AHSA1/START domain
MPTLQDTIEILSPPQTVWRVLSDPTFLPKLYNDAVTVEVDPPGHSSVGQTLKIQARVTGVRVAILAKYTRVDKESCLESKVVPGGLFSEFDHLVTLRVLGWGTEAKVTFQYAVAAEYASKVPDLAMMERAITDNFRTYAKNLKDLSELLPLPE